jgi:nicotinamidase-related amidase
VKTVVLVVDMQNDFIDKPELTNRRAGLIDAINRLTGHARLVGWPVFWIRQEFAADLSDALLEIRQRGIRITIAGTAGCEIASELERRSDETVVVKKRYSVFDTNLGSILAELNAQRIVLAGVNTHACVRMTAIDAYQREYPVIVLTKHLVQDDAWAADRLITPQQVYERDMKWLEDCDCLMAEVSGSSFGLGFETGYLLGATNKDAVLFYKREAEKKISLLITGNTHARCTLFPYGDIEEVKAFISRLAIAKAAANPRTN